MIIGVVCGLEHTAKVAVTQSGIGHGDDGFECTSPTGFSVQNMAVLQVLDVRSSASSPKPGKLLTSTTCWRPCGKSSLAAPLAASTIRDASNDPIPYNISAPQIMGLISCLVYLLISVVIPLRETYRSVRDSRGSKVWAIYWSIYSLFNGIFCLLPFLASYPCFHSAHPSTSCSCSFWSGSTTTPSRYK